MKIKTRKVVQLRPKQNPCIDLQLNYLHSWISKLVIAHNPKYIIHEFCKILKLNRNTWHENQRPRSFTICVYTYETYAICVYTYETYAICVYTYETLGYFSGCGKRLVRARSRIKNILTAQIRKISPTKSGNLTEALRTGFEILNNSRWDSLPD